MPTPELIAKGTTGEVHLFPYKLIIKRKGLFSFFLYDSKGDMSINIDSISTIIFKDATFRDGYFQISFVGGGAFKGGYRDTLYDPNAVFFKKRQQSTFEELRDIIEERIRPQQREATSIAYKSDADELEKLAVLQKRGVITEEEFSHKKRQILGI